MRVLLLQPQLAPNCTAAPAAGLQPAVHQRLQRQAAASNGRLNLRAAGAAAGAVSAAAPAAAGGSRHLPGQTALAQQKGPPGRALGRLPQPAGPPMLYLLPPVAPHCCHPLRCCRQRPPLPRLLPPRPLLLLWWQWWPAAAGRHQRRLLPAPQAARPPWKRAPASAAAAAPAQLGQWGSNQEIGTCAGRRMHAAAMTLLYAQPASPRTCSWCAGGSAARCCSSPPTSGRSCTSCCSSRASAAGPLLAARSRAAASWQNSARVGRFKGSPRAHCCQ